MNFEGKKLAILGAVAPLKDIILDCKKMGLYVIVIDLNTKAPCIQYADEYWPYSVGDVDAIVERCKDEGVHGIMNYCIDYGQKPYQKICEALNFPCVAGFEQFDIMTNKDRFSACCKEYGIGTIHEYEIGEGEPIPDSFDFHFPAVVKPVDSAASKGITVCQAIDELPSAISYAMQFSTRKKVLIQTQMKGQEVCAKYIAVDGELFMTSMSDIYYCLTDKGERVYLGTQVYPSKYYDEYIATTESLVKNMLHSIGIKNGAMSLTGFYDHGVFRFFDPSLRMGGAQDWRLVDAASGVDISKLLTHFALTGSMGDADEIRKIDKAFVKKSSALLYFDLKKGKIANFDGIEEALRIPGVVGYHQCRFVGDEIDSYGTVKNVAIRFILSCGSKEELKRTIIEVQKCVRITDAEGNNLIISPFDPNLV